MWEESFCNINNDRLGCFLRVCFICLMGVDSNFIGVKVIVW